MVKVLLVSGGYDHSIRFWDVSSATVVKQIQYPDSPINLLRISPGKSALSLHRCLCVAAAHLCHESASSPRRCAQLRP